MTRLPVDPTCAGVDTTACPDDRTIGDHVAGFLAEFGTEAGNRIAARCTGPVGNRLSCAIDPDTVVRTGAG